MTELNAHHLRDTPQGWDRAAQGWNAHTDLIRAWLSEASEAMLDAAHIGPGMSVLDIAAGAGDQTLAIAARVGATGRVLATDVSAAILAHAKHHAARQGLHQVDTQVLDAQQLGLGGANFDAAVCRMGLMFCTQPREALAQALQALKPGGRFSALVFSQPATNPCLVITLACAHRHASQRAPILQAKVLGNDEAQAYQPGKLMSLGQPGLLQELLSSVGFTHIEVRSIDAPLHLKSAHDYIDFLRSAASPIIDMLSGLTPEAQEAAWQDMAEQLQQFNHVNPAAPGWTGPNELLLCAAQAPSIKTARP
jgi:ubiquinone/menaquinone biosynthesis C-methylase UbiE